MGTTIDEARESAYQGYDAIQWTGKFCRRDIGTRVASRKERIERMLGGPGKRDSVS